MVAVKVTDEFLVGQRFGRLLVTGVQRIPVGRQGVRKRFALCICDCGNRKTVALASLGRSTKSCGCLRKELANRPRSHGLRRHPMYGAWLTMKSRCNNPNFPDYKHYGARGIFVSARWYNFAHFLADMGERPTNYTIERIDNNGPYAWWNCRWATRLEQAHNTRTNRRITWRGETLLLVDWSARFGISPATLHAALRQHGDFAAIERASIRHKKRIARGSKVYVRLSIRQETTSV